MVVSAARMELARGVAADAVEAAVVVAGTVAAIDPPQGCNEGSEWGLFCGDLC
jgi:hypothetical protein